MEVGGKKQFDHRDSPSDVYIVKRDSEGTQVWEKTYGGKKEESALAVTQSGDGGFIVAGYTWSGPFKGENVYLLKIDEGGNLVWENFYAYNDSTVNRATGIARADGFVVVGYTYSGLSKDIYIVQVDDSGEMVWERTYGGDKYEEADFVIQYKIDFYVFDQLNYDAWMRDEPCTPFVSLIGVVFSSENKSIPVNPWFMGIEYPNISTGSPDLQWDTAQLEVSYAQKNHA